MKQPLNHGIDVVMESCTKYLGGHCDLLGGSLATNNTKIYQELVVCQRFHGGGLPPFDSFLLARSLKTLCVRLFNQTPISISKNNEMLLILD